MTRFIPTIPPAVRVHDGCFLSYQPAVTAVCRLCDNISSISDRLIRELRRAQLHAYIFLQYIGPVELNP